MASTCDVYKGQVLLGAGSVEDGSTSLTSYSGTAPIDGRNVTVVITQAGTHAGKSIWTRILSGSGTATLTLRNSVPFVGA